MKQVMSNFHIADRQLKKKLMKIVFSDICIFQIRTKDNVFDVTPTKKLSPMRQILSKWNMTLPYFFQETTIVKLIKNLKEKKKYCTTKKQQRKE